MLSGSNNIIQGNLIAQIFWSGQAQPQFAEFNKNNDGAITTLKATSVIMKVNKILNTDHSM